ncbi:MAG: hypothetical protein KDE00_04865 [Rhodobacteraceae bacterium]|nr:hypothetical protein [Paracoccaceae bacterium]
MTDAARLAALAAISRMQKEADLARLAGAKLRCRRIEERLAALDSDLAAVRDRMPCEAAEMGQRDAYLRWSAGRRLSLDAELTGARAVMAVVEAAAARSFGRAEVLDDLTARARLARRQPRTGAD